MRRFRVSIAGLMALVLFAAVGVAALREASEVWSGVLFALTVATMAFGGLRAAYRDGAKRAFWAGFALFGSIYLTLAFAPGADARPALVSQNFLTWLHPKVAQQQATAAVTLTNQVMASWTAAGGVTTVATPPQQLAVLDYANTTVNPPAQLAFAPTSQVLFAWTKLDPTAFVRVGHCLLALVIAMLGGGIARWQWATAARSTIPVAAPPTTQEEPPCPAAAS